MIRRAVLAAVLGCVLAPSAAQGHATLEETSPQRGAQLDAPPSEVVLRFSEPVEAAFGALKVFDATGEEVQGGDVFRPGSDSRKIAVGLPDDMRGGYTATYRVISADSHPISGGFVFTVGEGAAPGDTVDELLAGSDAGSITWNGLSVARGVQYAAIALGLGAAIFLLFAWVPALSQVTGSSEPWRTASERFGARLRTLGVAAALAGALSAAAAVILQGAVASATSFWSAMSYDTVREILSTRFGTVWGLAAVAWLIVAALLFARVASLPRLRPASVGATGLAPRYPRSAAVALVPLAFLAAVPALGGHAAAQDPTWLLLPANVLHVLAMAAWLGGIAVLVVALRAATAVLEPHDRTRLLAATVARFSALAGLAIAVVLATGVAQSVVHLDSFGNLLDTAFGRAILVKFGLFVVIVALGWVNRNRLLPQLRRAAAEGGSPARAGLLLRRTLRVEMALGAAVIVATAALASYAPASSVTGGPFSTDFELGPARAEMTIDPAEVGANEVHLYFFRRDDGSQWNETRELRMAAALPEKEIPAIELDPRKAGPGHYVVTRAQLGVAGDWQVEIVSRVSEFEEHRAIVEVPVR